jgi:hypothetical protein
MLSGAPSDMPSTPPACAKIVHALVEAGKLSDPIRHASPTFVERHHASVGCQSAEHPVEKALQLYPKDENNEETE